MSDDVTGAMGSVVFVPGTDPDFFTYAATATRATSGYSLDVRTQAGDPIRGGCQDAACLPNSDVTTALSAFTPLTVVPAATYPPGLEDTYSPGAFPNTACLPGVVSTMTLRPLDFFGNTPLDVNTASYGAVLEVGGVATSVDTKFLDGDFVLFEYTCPSTPSTAYTIDVTHAGNGAFPQRTFQVSGVSVESELVFATLTPVQEVGQSFAVGDSSGGPTSAWDMEDVALGQSVTWTLEEWTNSSYMNLSFDDSLFHVTLQDRVTGELLFPSPVTVRVAGMPGTYTVTFVPERVGDFSVHIFKSSVLAAEIVSPGGVGFNVTVAP